MSPSINTKGFTVFYSMNRCSLSPTTELYAGKDMNFSKNECDRLEDILVKERTGGLSLQTARLFYSAIAVHAG